MLVRTTGFHKLRSTLQAMPETLDNRLRPAVERSVSRMEQNMKDKLGTDDPSWPPLAQQTLDRSPDRLGGPLLDQGVLRDAITVRVEDNRSLFTEHLTFHVGVPASALAIDHAGREVSVGDYAFAQEFGSDDGHIPARPFMRPAALEELWYLKGWGRTAIRDGLHDLLANQHEAVPD